MLAQGRGSIVNVTSGTHTGQPRYGAYGATKGALDRLVIAQIDHLQDKGVLARQGSDVALPGGDTPQVVLSDDDSVAVVLGRAEEEGLEVTDEDVFHVVGALHSYLEEIGAVGPPAAG